MAEGEQIETTGTDVIRAMNTELFIDFPGVRPDARKAEELEEFAVNLVMPDKGE